jgi:stage II sporulation protein D
VRRLLLPSLLVVLAAASATADAAVRHVVRGAGFGHGIGMSQYGAYGFALKGRSYAQILAHYYRGTRLDGAPSRPVRVLLQPVDPYIRVQGVTAANGSRLRAGTTYVARPSGSRILVTTAGGRRVARFGSPAAGRCGCSGRPSTGSRAACTGGRSRWCPRAAG